MYEHDISGEPSNRRYNPLVSEWSNPLISNNKEIYLLVYQGTQGTETSQYLEEEKSYEIPLVVASESGTA